MIDEFMCRRSARRYITDVDTDPSVPTRTFWLPEPLNVRARKFAAIVEPWNGGGRAIDILAGRLVCRGYAVQKVKMDSQVL